MRDFTDITYIIDRSGSMDRIASDVVGGYAKFIKEQKALGDNAAMTLVEFDHEYNIVFSGVPIRNVSEQLTFIPRGMTALHDAIGRTIVTVGARLAALPESERPDKVLFVIQTDGAENYSREYSLAKVRELVTQQQSKYNWHFLFLGANIDSFGVGQALGINALGIANYAYNALGAQASARAVSSYTSCLRSQGSQVAASLSMNALYQKAETELSANTDTLTANSTSATAKS